MIIRRVIVGPFATNCYIVGSEEARVGMIIDPGADGRRIMSSVNELRLDIKLIVLTHGHIDHIGALREVKEATLADVCIHASDARFLRERPLSTAFGTRYPTVPVSNCLLKGGDSVDVGDLHFLVVHTPGHTPGGISLVGHGVAFTGDALFNFGVGRTDFPGGSHTQLINSIQTKLMVLPDNTAAYPGHGPETTIGIEMYSNPFLADLGA